MVEETHESSVRVLCPNCKTEYRTGFEVCSDCNVKLIYENISETEKKVDRLLKSKYRKRYWLAILVGFAIPFILLFFRPYHAIGFFLGPIVAGYMMKKGADGAGVGFVSLFFLGFIIPLGATNLAQISTILPISQVITGGVLGGLLFGFGLGIWPGLVFGFIGGLIGKAVYKRQTSKNL